MEVSTIDISNQKGCQELIEKGQRLGSIGGILNLCTIVRSKFFAKQTAQDFIDSVNTKALSTKWLDEISREQCPSLEHFVGFSSTISGRGVIGETSYGMANSMLERIIERRVAAGYPGKVIQWGAIADVGLVAHVSKDMMYNLGGTLHQKLASCFQVLDTLLLSPEPVVQSIVVAKKINRQATSNAVVDFLLNSIGVKDIKSIRPEQKMGDFGLDSLMVVELIQTFQRDFQVALTPTKLRNSTFHELVALTKKSQNVTHSV